MVKTIVFALLVACLASANAWAQESPPPAPPESVDTSGFRPLIEEPKREGDEVVLRGAAPPGTKVVATLGNQQFQTVAGDRGQWWLKFTPGSARRVVLRVGDYQEVVELVPRDAPVEVTVTPARVQGPMVELKGTAPDNVVMTLLADDEVVARAQPQATRWKLAGEIPDGVRLAEVIATDAAGQTVASRSIEVTWAPHPLDLEYPKTGRIATPFGVRGTTTPGVPVRVTVAEEVVELTADEEGKFHGTAPTPPRGTTDLRVEVAPGTDRSTSTSVQLQVINTLKPPMGRIVAGAFLGAALGGALGLGYGWWMGDLLYTCTYDCVVDVREVQVASAIYGANFGVASLTATGMHVLAHSAGFNGSYATAAGASGATMLLIWTLGLYLLPLYGDDLPNFTIYSSIVTGVGALAAAGISVWAYTARGDQTRRKLSLRPSPNGIAVVGSW